MRWLSYATIFSALSGFVVISIAAWALGADSADQFQAYWGLFFALGGCTDGLMQETARGVSQAQENHRWSASGKPWLLGAQIAMVVALGIVASSWLWMPLVVDSDHLWGTGVMAIGLVGYIFQAVLSGVLSGLGLWRQYAALLSVDAMLRLVFALISWELSWGLRSFMLMTVIGSAAWIIIVALSPHRGTILHALSDVDARHLRSRAFSAMLATGASAALITGFPVFVQAAQNINASTPTSPTITVAGIILAVTLSRAPILVPLTRFQSALIVRCVENQERIFAALITPIGLVMGVGVLGALAAWAIGPWILDTFYGTGYVIPGPTLAVLTFASACTGTLMITGAASLAKEKHRHYVCGWGLASLFSIAVLLLPLPLDIRVCAALISGPLLGAITHLVSLR